MNVSTITRQDLLKELDELRAKVSKEETADSKDWYRALFESANDAVFVYRRPSENGKPGPHMDVNEVACKRLGYTKEELLKLTPADVIAPERRDLIPQLQNRQAGQRNVVYETTHITKDGRRIKVENNSHLFEFRGEQIIMLISRDITKRKKMEQEVQNARDWYTTLFESGNDAVFVYKRTQESKQGQYVDANEVACRRLGYTKEELLKMSPFDIIPKGRLKRAPEIRKRLLNKQHIVYEAVHITKNGKRIPVENSAHLFQVNGEPIVIVSSRDITERKRAQSDLLKLNSAVEQAHDGIAIFGSETRTISYINEAYANMLGYSKEELIGTGYRHLNSRLLNSQRPTLGEVLNANDPNIQTVEIEHLRKDGTLVPALVSFAHIKNRRGKHIDVIVVAKDITEQKLLEQEREKHRQQLEDMIKDLNRTNVQIAATNKELEAFNYSVSHDLRSPLRSIDGFSQALLEDYADVLDDDGKNYLGRVRKASQRMGQLIDDLLGLSRLTRGKMNHETVDLRAMAQVVAEELQMQDTKRKVDFTISEGITVDADARMLRVVLNNLLGNAWKFTSKNPQAKIELGITESADGKTFFVKDNGVGFNMAYVNKLFGAFQRLHGMNEFPGNGIGLATVQRVINRHGGKTWAQGEEGIGATFYFTL